MKRTSFYKKDVHEKSSLRSQEYLTVILSFALVLMSSSVYALEVSASGTCREFDILVQNDEPGCWDAKITASGEILHPDGWKDSADYLESFVCGNSQAIMKIRLSTNEDTSTFIKLRQLDTVRQKALEIDQQCAGEINIGGNAIIPAIAGIIIIAGFVFLYMRKSPRKGSTKKRR